MRIAIPVSEGTLATHFGHCEQFVLLDVELQKRTVLGRQDIQAPLHEPGLLPRWLSEQGVHMIIAGGMGQRALDLFTRSGIKVFTGAPVAAPEHLVHKFMHGSLAMGANCCDH